MSSSSVDAHQCLVRIREEPLDLVRGRARGRRPRCGRRARVGPRRASRRPCVCCAGARGGGRRFAPVRGSEAMCPGRPRAPRSPRTSASTDSTKLSATSSTSRWRSTPADAACSAAGWSADTSNGASAVTRRLPHCHEHARRCDHVDLQVRDRSSCGSGRAPRSTPKTYAPWLSSSGRGSLPSPGRSAAPRPPRGRPGRGVSRGARRASDRRDPASVRSQPREA